MAYWYLRHERELLLDLDFATKHVKRPGSKGPQTRSEGFRQRLQTAIREGLLDVEAVWKSESNTERKYHVAVLLKKPVSELEALIWQFHFFSDLLRSKSDLMRYAQGIKPASLLIRNAKFPQFWREPDAQCPCVKKHDTAKMMELGESACDVWKRLRGANPWSLFGRTADVQRYVILPTGSVPLELILRRDVVVDAPQSKAKAEVILRSEVKHSGKYCTVQWKGKK